MKAFNRDEWIETGCEYIEAEYYDKICKACPYVVYDKHGFPKCDRSMMENCEHISGDEEFNLDPVAVLDHWNNVLNSITKLVYKNANLTNAQLRRILEGEMCMKIENANWDDWKDVD